MRVFGKIFRQVRRVRDLKHVSFKHNGSRLLVEGGLKT